MTFWWSLIDFEKPSLKISGGFFVRCPMNYLAFTNGILTMMHEAVRGALAADDALKEQGEGATEWKAHAAELEGEKLRRDMFFGAIDCTEDQPNCYWRDWPAQHLDG